ncbi:MAG: PKD domain-containing protein [Parcubacteria group bacterium]|nr:PKD domain-containing protein [Parcubacteria group bacterium]
MKEGEIYFDHFLSSGAKGGYTEEQLYTRSTTFSLNNGGEEIVLYDNMGTEVSIVSYDPSTGGNNNGNTLSLTSSGTWLESTPTPGVWDGVPPAPVENDDEDDEGDDTGIEENDTDDSSGGGGQWIPDPDIYAYAGEDKEVVAGASVMLSGVAGDASGERMERAEYVWNFGDGEIKRGESLMHTYRYPGTYIAHLTVISGDISAHDTITIVAVAPDVQVVGYERGGLDPYVALMNSGSEMIDLSYWRIRVAGDMFRIPEYTYIAPKTELRFSRETMNMDFPATTDVALLYPNLRVVDALIVSAETIENTTETARGVPIPESSHTSAPPRAATQTSSQAYTPATVSYAEVPEMLISENTEMREESGKGESEDGVAEEDQTGSVYYSLTANTSAVQTNRQAWFFALGGIIILGIAGVSVIHKKDESAQLQLQQKSASQESDAEEYEILED